MFAPEAPPTPASYPTPRARRDRGRRGARRIVAALLAAAGASCGSLNLFSVQDDARIGAEAYPELLAGEPVVTSGPEVRRVERVFGRLREVIEGPGFDWEVRVIEDDSTVNAWALPGGKMAVYTGLLEVARTDAELATVIGHEMAHALSRHGTQRMTYEILSDTLIGLSLDQAAEAEQYARVGSQLLGLSYSRDAELEADRIGFFAMARAGYDPRAAPRFWRRMAELGGGGGLALLSTHPTDEARIEQLESLMDEALAMQPEAL